jgi:spermidine synthase
MEQYTGTELTERDEFAFHEMMAHLPLFSHRNPERILIVGGGDGGVLREVCKHSQVKEITIVEIDEMVVQVSKEHLQLAPPELFDDPRVNIIHADAAKFLQDPGQSGRYDIVIADTLDPLGPAESLFEPEFYEAMHTALKSDGIICTQAESLWIHFELIKDLVGCCANIFQYCEYATTNVPSYPCGQIGFVLARKGESRSCRYPVRKLSFQKDLKFYSPQMHQAAFALPRYVEDELKPLNQHNQSYQEDNLLDDDESEEKCFLHACQIQ